MGKWEIPPRGGQMDLPSGVYYQTMTGHQVKERLKKNDLIIIPVGSTENHGEHACPGEDTFLVTRMAEQVAKATGCTVAEPVWYGSHPFHHLGMPGTIVIPEEDLSAYLRAVIAGFWNSWLSKANSAQRPRPGLRDPSRDPSICKKISGARNSRQRQLVVRDSATHQG